MQNHYPWWKYLIIAMVIIPGIFYALPNLFGDDPGLQIRGTRGNNVDSAFMARMESTLKAGSIEPKSVDLTEDTLKIRFVNGEQQLKARDLLASELKDHYTAALTLLPATPSWMDSINARPMYLGLDLRGGVHFLMEVDMDKAVGRAIDRYVSDIKNTLRDQGNLRYRGVRRRADGGIEIRMRDVADVARAEDILERELVGLTIAEGGDADTLVANLKESEINSLKEFAVEQNMTALRNRIDELGVAEPVVQKQGDKRIVIQLPGVQDTAKAKEILGRTATLEMMMVDEEHSLDSALAGNVPAGSRIYRMRDGRPILLQRRVIYSGENIVDAAASIDNQTGGAVVSITLDAVGARINQRITGDNIGKRMAVVYIEAVSNTRVDANGNPVLDKDGNVVRDRSRIEEVITAPVIRDQLGQRFQIEGLDSVDEARDLSLLLRAGALAAPVEIIEERTVGPSLGQTNINQGFLSVAIGFTLVLIFMLAYYRYFGLFADIALALNLVLLIAVLSLFQATLTLPGVAGIVLTVGMAVDANVLIFERIREELRNGNSPQASIFAGYQRALSTIVDANVTTLIAAIVLFNFGTGPIKGFAITLSIGILTSMFTSIMITRGLVNFFYGGKKLRQLKI
ncbi:MAG: protein translocase subunit SecD [marine bacterium B5-7]|nr:MAG: protein translocase subunit SecD [marine bacterium B5-7]